MLTDFPDLRHELAREDFRYVVPDFRLNKDFDKLDTLTRPQKAKVEFLQRVLLFRLQGQKSLL